MKPVHIKIEDSVHFRLNDSFADEDWESLLPSGGLHVYLGPDRRPFTVSMFHQLRCLDIIRHSLLTTDEKRPGEDVRHCMNYLRQMIRCRLDLRVQPMKSIYKKHNLNSLLTHTCQDWRVPYEMAEENFAQYQEWKKGLA